MMKKIKAEIIADSITKRGHRATSFVLTFPRIILAELNTHRAFSRNSASSRAIPFSKMAAMVIEDPFIPVAFQADHSGMQGTRYLKDEALNNARTNWVEASQIAVKSATCVHQNHFNNDHNRVTKQLCNRILEPFMWHTAIVTSTDYDNFLNLRCPRYVVDGNEYFSREVVYEKFSQDELLELGVPNRDDDLGWLELNVGYGEIHIMLLAEKIYDALRNNSPIRLNDGDWHVPFGDNLDEDRIIKDFDVEINESTSDVIDRVKIKIATARCARVSYLNFNGKDDYLADVKLFDMLKNRKHASPFEHCQRAMTDEEFKKSQTSGNSVGYVQLRKIMGL